MHFLMIFSIFLCVLEVPELDEMQKVNIELIYLWNKFKVALALLPD